MRTTENNKVTCVFCGTTRTITSWWDDGVDYMGHGRGQANSGSNDEGCDCPLGKLAHKPVSMKPMCLNCDHQKNDYCTCEKVLQNISKMFDVGGRVGIKDMKAVCEHYKLNRDVLHAIVADDEKTKKAADALW